MASEMARNMHAEISWIHAWGLEMHLEMGKWFSGSLDGMFKKCRIWCAMSCPALLKAFQNTVSIPP
jgi:hypothetical protein